MEEPERLRSISCKVSRRLKEHTLVQMVNCGFGDVKEAVDVGIEYVAPSIAGVSHIPELRATRTVRSRGPKARERLAGFRDSRSYDQ